MVAATTALLVLPAPALGAASVPAIGMGDQQPAMFSSPLFRSLSIRRVRYVVAYDAALTSGFERSQADALLNAAHAGGYDVLVAFEHSREPGRARHLPSVTAYLRGVRAFRKRYPFVHTFSPWDEVNDCVQPTCHDPRMAAEYYLALRRACPHCTIVAADVLDTNPGAMARYLRTVEHYAARANPRLWGLHDYSDVNRFRSIGTRTMLRTVPGTVWLTETGGLYSFGRDFPPSASRQVRAERQMFRLARTSRRIRRVYLYSWSGGGRFDAGLMNPHGKPRPAYRVVADELRR
jgi:hypothetical protein